MRFDKLNIGAMFNTAIGRWVKISDTDAIYVMGSVQEIGEKVMIPKAMYCIVLYN